MIIYVVESNLHDTHAEADSYLDMVKPIAPVLELERLKAKIGLMMMDRNLGLTKEEARGYLQACKDLQDWLQKEAK